MGKRAFDAQLAALDALRDSAADQRVEGLRKALGNRNNFLVAKAADIIRELHLKDLTPDLLKAFDRFFGDAEKTDPQCWAKIAIGRALASFELQEADVFLRGMRHFQMEPVYGGRSDSAGPLRAACALALVQCRSLSNDDLLSHLIELFADGDKTVRAEAARAIEQVGSSSATLLLRLRATLGKDEPEVLGACYSGVLRIEGVQAIPWVSHFLRSGDDAAGEAALAISATHSVEGFEALKSALDTAHDPWFRSVLLSAIALTREDAALEFLLDLVGKESLHAEGALEAIIRSLPSAEIIQRLEKAVRPNPQLLRTFENLRKS